jgi:ATP-dependent helicase HrpB
LKQHQNLVIEAAPGAGKTTRVPPALLAFGEAIVLEPRRIAARMAARRVAEELGEKAGERVGYQVRFEEVAGPRTRLRFVTEGVLTRRLISDPLLRGVSVVVLDEFHERHLETDLGLTLLRRLQQSGRPDLRIVIMSATLDAAPVSRFLGDCPCVSSEGRLFPLDIRHSHYSAAPLEDQVAAAVEASMASPGDVLVFLPGAGEIRKAERACADVARRHGLLITPLYGDLSPADQDLAVSRSDRRKLILSTNLAESSITIEGVRTVIDSGLARVASDSPWTGLPLLEVKRISKASAKQRAGRAGRTGPGQVIRLFTAEDFQRRPDHDAPEILRRELAQMCLQLESGGIHDPLQLEWLDPPPTEALQAASRLLDLLGARGTSSRSLAAMPLHPRLGRLAIDGGDRGCRVAALLSSGQRVQSSDLFRAMNEPWDGRTKAVYEQLRRFAGRRNVDDAGLAQAVLAAFPDRVGRKRSGETILLSNGTSATMAHPPAEFLVALDVDARNDRPAPVIRLACPIEPEWLMDRVTEKNAIEWNKQPQRVEAVSSLLYDNLVIEETRGGRIDDEAAAQVLAAKVVEAGIDRFVDRPALDAFLARLEFSHLGVAGDEGVLRALTSLCYGLRSFADVEKAAARLIPMLEQQTGVSQLETNAPSRLKLAGGRSVKVNYETGKPPWVASRLQDFFGMSETPRLGRAKVPLVIHLLAPNQRPVQTTTDLAGFWERLYPQLRRELGRRYPRHSWPEKPV